VSAASPEKLAKWRHRHHWEMLVVSIVVIAAAFALSVGKDETVGFGRSPALRLPPLCASRALFGVDCPGCGLTRCFVLLAHGRWAESFAMNRAGGVVAMALLVQIPYRIIAIRRHESLPLGVWLPRIVGWTVIAALVGNWMARLAGI
jgi:hypothetical protein